MSEIKKVIKLPHLVTPIEFGDFLNKIVYVLYRLSKPSSSKEIKEKESSLPLQETIGRGSSYLIYLGLAIERGGRGKFELNENGRKIAVEMAQGRQEEADKIWKEVLQNHYLYELIKKYILEKCSGLTGSSIGLGEYLREESKQKWVSIFVKEGAKRLCNLYSSKGLLEFNIKEDIISLPKIKEPIPPTPLIPTPSPPITVLKPAVSQEEILKPTPIAISKEIQPMQMNVNIQLSIQITDQTNIELAKEIFVFLLKLRENKKLEIKTE